MTATITDVELSAAVYGAEPPCELIDAHGVKCGATPAVWLLIMPCGCSGVACDGCRETLLANDAAAIARGIYAGKCRICLLLFGLTRIRWERL